MQQHIFPKIGMVFVVVLLLSGLVMAYGINAPVLSEEDSKLLYLDPGMSETLEFKISNQGGAKSDSLSTIVIKDGSDIVSLRDGQTEYLVPAGEKTPFFLEVSIPEDAEIGEVHDVRLEITGRSVDETGGLVSFGSSIGHTFQVAVGIPKEKVDYTPYIRGFVVIIIALLVFFWLWKRRKDEQDKKKTSKKK